MSETEKRIQNPQLPAIDDCSSTTSDGVPTKDQDVEQQQVFGKQPPSQNERSCPVPIRTGFLLFPVIVPPIADSKHYNCLTKWMLTIIVALAALAAPLGSNILLRK